MNRYAVIGEHLPHTLSPEIHNYIFEKMGISESYGILEVPTSETDGLLSRLMEDGIKGTNVTIPYKETLIPQLDSISPEALKIGAVNTIHFDNGKTTGHNTDYYGFKMMLERASISVTDKDCVVIGAGGAAKAIIALLDDLNAKSITVLSKSDSRFEGLKKLFPFIKTGLLTEDDLIKGDVVINSTPLGMYPNNMDKMAITEEQLARFSAAADIVYNPIDTKFLIKARENGLKIANGLYMLIYQAIRAEEIYQNKAVPDEIADELYNLLSKKF